MREENPRTWGEHVRGRVHAGNGREGSALRDCATFTAQYGVMYGTEQVLTGSPQTVSCLRMGQPRTRHSVVSPYLLDGEIPRVRCFPGDYFSQGMKRNPAGSSDSTPFSRGASDKVSSEQRDGVHDAILPDTVRMSIPYGVGPMEYADLMAGRDIRDVLAVNVQRLVAHKEGIALDPANPLAERLYSATVRRARVPMGTAQRILDADTSIGISIVAKIARALGVQAYQLLIPDLDPADPVRLPASPEERRLLRALKLAVGTIGISGEDDAESSGEDGQPSGRATSDGATGQGADGRAHGDQTDHHTKTKKGTKRP